MITDKGTSHTHFSFFSPFGRKYINCIFKKISITFERLGVTMMTINPSVPRIAPNSGPGSGHLPSLASFLPSSKGSPQRGCGTPGRGPWAGLCPRAHRGQDHKLSLQRGAGGTHSCTRSAILQIPVPWLDRKRTDSKQTPAPTLSAPKDSSLSEDSTHQGRKALSDRPRGAGSSAGFGGGGFKVLSF